MAKEVALYRITKSFGRVSILGEDILPRYTHSYQRYNDEAKKILGKFNSSDGELTGSSPFMVVQLLDSGLLPKGARLAGRKELEESVSFDQHFLYATYVDFGLALRTAGDLYAPNDLLARSLAKQLTQRGITLDNGKLIPLTALTLVQNLDSVYGLSFALREDAEKEIQDLDAFSWYSTRREGLAVAYLFSRSLHSSNERLGYSNSDGRVVVVSPEVSS